MVVDRQPHVPARFLLLNKGLPAVDLCQTWVFARAVGQAWKLAQVHGTQGHVPPVGYSTTEARLLV